MSSAQPLQQAGQEAPAVHASESGPAIPGLARVLVPVLSFLLHGYIAWRLLPSLSEWPYALVLVTALLALSSLVMPLGLLNLGRRLKRPTEWVAWVTWLSVGLFSSMFVLTVLRDLVLIVLAALGLAWPAVQDLAGLASISSLMVPLAATLMTALGLVEARRTASVVHVEVPILSLPQSLAGFTIAQISDVHVGSTIKRRYVDAIVEAVNWLGADMIAITGDLVDGSVADLARHVAPLANLCSRHGTFFVTGNHEYYSGAHDWIAELRRLNVQVLLNRHVVLQHDGRAVVVAGVTDPSAHHFVPEHRSDPHASLRGAPTGAALRLLLAHQPRSAMAAADAGFHLQLSGHTHGGQFFPWNFFVRLQQPFVAGLHRLRGLWVYVNRGTGYWGPPKRFGVPSEITCLTLVPAMP
jgi:predicted MPP superfamily phosphohydrolase